MLKLLTNQFDLNSSFSSDSENSNTSDIELNTNDYILRHAKESIINKNKLINKNYINFFI